MVLDFEDRETDEVIKIKESKDLIFMKSEKLASFLLVDYVLGQTNVQIRPIQLRMVSQLK